MIVKIFLISSLILNSFLLIYLFGILPFLLFISTLINISTIGYIKFLVNERVKVQNHFNSLMMETESFFAHLSSIYELEMFYGDETLENLINHSKRLINNFYDFEEEYLEDQIEGDAIIDDGSEETETSEEKEKSILHEGA